MKGWHIIVLFVIASGCGNSELPTVPPQTGPNTRADVVGSLNQTGVDVKAPMAFALHFRFPDQQAGSKAKADLEKFVQRVALAQDGPSAWAVRAVKTMVPDSGQTESVLLKCRQIAGEHGGTFEGWEIDFGR